MIKLHFTTCVFVRPSVTIVTELSQTISDPTGNPWKQSKLQFQQAVVLLLL